MFMIKTPIFIQGGGGYSQLVADMVRRNNGTVIYDKEFLKNLYKSKRMYISFMAIRVTKKAIAEMAQRGSNIFFIVAQRL